MYDGKSLTRLLSEAGFVDARVMPAGLTNIADPHGLDLAERAAESVYVEAVQSALEPSARPGDGSLIQGTHVNRVSYAHGRD